MVVLQSFDRGVIQGWWDDIQKRYPETYEVFKHCVLVPHFLLQNQISDWCKLNGVDLPTTHEEELTKETRNSIIALLMKLSLSTPEQKGALKELCQLAQRSSGVRTLFGKIQMIENLMHPLSSVSLADTEFRNDLLLLLQHLSVLDKNKIFLGENEKIMVFLVDSLKSCSAQVRIKAAGTLASFACLDSNKHIIGNSGAIKFLVSLLKEEDQLGLKTAGSAIYKLCFLHENIVRTVQEGAVEIILGKLVGQILIDEFLILLELLCSNRSAVEALICHEGLKLIIKILRESSQERMIEETSITILHIICCQDRANRLKMKEEELANGTISKVVQSGSSRARRKLALSFANCKFRCKYM